LARESTGAESNFVIVVLFLNQKCFCNIFYFIWTCFVWTGCCRSSWVEGDLGLACSCCISGEWKCLDC